MSNIVHYECPAVSWPLGGEGISVHRYVRKVARRDDGASAVEYGLLVAAIAAVIVIVVFALGTAVKTTLYDKTCANIKGGGSGPVDC